MRQLLRYLFKQDVREKLPRLGGGIQTHYDPSDVTGEIELVLMMGIARDPAGAKELLAKHEVDTALDLLEALPRRRVDWRGRLKKWVQHIEGSTGTNPDKKEFLALKKEKRNG